MEVCYHVNKSKSFSTSSNSCSKMNEDNVSIWSAFKMYEPSIFKLIILHQTLNAILFLICKSSIIHPGNFQIECRVTTFFYRCMFQFLEAIKIVRLEINGYYHCMYNVRQLSLEIPHVMTSISYKLFWFRYFVWMLSLFLKLFMGK